MLHLKKFIPGLMLLSLPFSSSATKTILCGHFQNDPKKTVVLTYYANAIDRIEGTQTKLECDVDANSNFRLELNIDKPTMINVRNGETSLFYNKFINPGDSLWFDFAPAKIHIEGIGENGIIGMFEYDATLLTSTNNSERGSSFKTKTDVEFAKFWDGQTDSGLAFYNRYFAEHPAPAQYVSAVKAELTYDAMVNMVQFGWRGKNGNEGIFNNPDYMRYFTKYAYSDSSALVSDYYQFFIGEFTKFMLQPTAWRSSRKIEYYERLRLRDSVARKCFSGSVYDVALYQILYSGIEQLGRTKGSNSYDSNYTKTTSIINELGPRLHDQALLARLNEKLKAVSEDGKPAYDFSGVTPEGKKVRLSDFKGKIVYADFWATSCVPCVQELPHIKRLQEKYKGQAIVFLYFSFDQSTEVLKRFIREQNFTGVHITDPKGFASDAAINYHIDGIPRHIIVDKNGILVNSDAPRPSNQPEQILDKLLGKTPTP